MLTIEIKDNNRGIYHIYMSDSFNEISKYLDKLDGDRYDEMLIKNGKTLTVGGGENQKYIIMYTMPEATGGYHPVRELKQRRRIGMSIGGQAAIIDRKYIFNRTSVNKIIKYYLQKNSRHPGIRWERF